LISRVWADLLLNKSEPPEFMVRGFSWLHTTCNYQTNQQKLSKVTKKTLNCRGHLVDLTVPAVMGILNITPDSFYSGSRSNTEKSVETARMMLADGATFLDIGGYSTRPGAADVSPAEEADRVLPVIEAILTDSPGTLISVDTFRASVARQAVKAGACLINDVSGGLLDPTMFATVADLPGVPYVLMHMRGTPQTMQALATYENIVTEVMDELATQLAALRALGVHDVIIDPGFGFAKTPAQNFFLLSMLNSFQQFNEPLLVGLSRKKTIWKTLGITADEALNGTTVLNTAALLKGASILRVHDVRAAVEAVKLTQQLTFF
jgi:dihydropteroate synthase